MRITLAEVASSIEEALYPLVIDAGEEVGVVRLRSVMGLTARERARYGALIEAGSKSADDKDTPMADVLESSIDQMRDILELVADDVAVLRRFLAAHGDTAVILQWLFQTWSKASRPGEATPSQS